MVGACLNNASFPCQKKSPSFDPRHQKNHLSWSHRLGLGTGPSRAAESS